MSVSEQQTDLDEVVDELRGFEAGDTVTLVTDAGTVTARVTATRWHTDAAAVTFEDCENDRRVRVSTEWYGGWLDPLVDVSTADLEDSDATTFEFHRPLGALVDVRLVTAAADQHGRSRRS